MVAFVHMTLGDICAAPDGLIQTGPFGSQLHAHEYSSTGVAVIMPQDIAERGHIDPKAVARVPARTAAGLPRHHLRKYDIVYSRRGDVEKCALVAEHDLPAICGTGCLLVRVDPMRADARFVNYRLSMADTRRWISQHAVGATMPNLNTSILSEVPLTLPPLPEQQAIAEVLGALDDKIAANAALIRQTDKLLTAEHARTLGTARTTVTYVQIAEIGGGGTPSTRNADYWDGDICWAAPSDITALATPYLLDTPRKVTKQGLVASASPIYPVGSILMTSRATIGAFAIAECPTAVNQGFIVVSPHQEESKWWLFHEMRRRVPEYITQANGATFLELPRGVFNRLTLEMPNATVLAEFHAFADALHASSLAATRESQTLASLRDTLLPALMNGTLRVKDAIAQAEEVL